MGRKQRCPECGSKKFVMKANEKNVKSAILLGQEELQEKHLKKAKSDIKNPL